MKTTSTLFVAVAAIALFGAGCRANMQANIEPQPVVPSQPAKPLPKDANGNPKTGDVQLDGYVNDGSMTDPDDSVMMDDNTMATPPTDSTEGDASVYLNL